MWHEFRASCVKEKRDMSEACRERINLEYFRTRESRQEMKKQTGAFIYDYHVKTFTHCMRSTGNIRMKQQAVKNKSRVAAQPYSTAPNEQFRFDQMCKRLDSESVSRAPKLQARLYLAWRYGASTNISKYLRTPHTASDVRVGSFGRQVAECLN